MAYNFSLVICCFLQTLPLILSIDYSLLDAYRLNSDEKLTAIENLINVSSESFYLKSVSGSNAIITQTPILSVNCSLAFDKFSDGVLNFTRCTVKYARPIHVCMKCGNEYEAYEAAYENLRKQSSKCEEFFFSSDRLAIVDIVYNGLNNIWEKSFCEQCYENINQTEQFFRISNDLFNCISHSNKSDIMSANNTCQECQPLFGNLSLSYNKFVLKREEFDNDGGICMDVVDTMNISRTMWAEFNCSPGFESTIGFLNILTALTVGATPVMFYLLSKNISRLEDVKLVRPKRKSTIIIHVPPPEQ